MYKHIVFALFASLLLIGNAHADVTFITSCPYTITQPGQYHLAQDLTCPPAGPGRVDSGIVVQANDVELHFDGHTLTSSGALIGVFGIGVSNLSIHGPGTITGFPAVGISLGVSGALIVNITATNNRIVGINIFGSGNTLISNTANGNRIDIQLLNSVTNNTVRANQTDGNSIGILVDSGSTGNLLQANQAHNNGADLEDDNPPGPPCANTWKSNHFATSSGAGVSCIH